MTHFPTFIRPVSVLFILLLALPPEQGVAQSSETLSFGAWIQPVWEIQDWEDARTQDGAFIRRARLDATASFFDGLVRIRLMPDISRTAELRDAWIEAAVADGVGLRMGQQTIPFHSQRVTHGGRQHFGDRSIATRRFELPGGRDIGATLNWRDTERKRSLQLGAFNGEGINRRAIGPGGPLLSARGAIAVTGDLPGGESDLARTSSPALTLGIGAMSARESLLRTRPGFVGDTPTDWWSGTADFGLRWQGMSAAGAWYLHRIDPRSDAADEIRGQGWHLSAGWIPPSRRFELAVRRSEAEWDESLRGVTETETGLGLTIFHRGHALQTRVQVYRWAIFVGSTHQRGNGLVMEHQFLLGG